MFRVLRCDDIGMQLTDSMAMAPAASVSGFYLAHPQAAYFNVGKLGDDQLQDWARRSRQDVDSVRRALAAIA
jgi:5-methyltetrahydrofolate--homocysteine methyltransferase